MACPGGYLGRPGRIATIVHGPCEGPTRRARFFSPGGCSPNACRRRGRMSN